MAIQTYRARVAEHSYLASKYQQVHLELTEPPRLEFRAGQYVMMKVPGVTGVRQYSITSPPSMNHAIELLVDVIPGGLGSMYLASLAPGDEVEFMAPAGAFTMAHEEGGEEKLLFVATGSGIAPVRAMLLDLLVDKKDTRPMWLHWGLRYAEDVFWFDEFSQLAEEYDNFTFDLTLSKPPEDWELCTGYVTQCVLKHHSDFSTMSTPRKAGPTLHASHIIAAYLCGNRRMIEDVRMELTRKGVVGTRIHTEQFYS